MHVHATRFNEPVEPDLTVLSAPRSALAGGRKIPLVPKRIAPAYSARCAHTYLRSLCKIKFRIIKGVKYMHSYMHANNNSEHSFMNAPIHNIISLPHDVVASVAQLPSGLLHERQLLAQLTATSATRRELPTPAKYTKKMFLLTRHIQVENAGNDSFTCCRKFSRWRPIWPDSPPAARCRPGSHDDAPLRMETFKTTIILITTANTTTTTNYPYYL